MLGPSKTPRRRAAPVGRKKSAPLPKGKFGNLYACMHGSSMPYHVLAERFSEYEANAVLEESDVKVLFFAHYI